MTVRGCIVVAVTGLIGCAQNEGASAPLAEGAATAKGSDAWTLAVYMAADNDLEPDALDDVGQMIAASHPGLRFFVELDRAGESPFGVGTLPGWTGAQRFVVEDQTIASAGMLGTIDSGAPASLASFVAFAAGRAGSDHLGIVLWGHGHGARGVCEDRSSSNRLSSGDAGRALRAGLDAAGAERAEFLGFDACSMADLLVAADVSHAARWMLASQNRTPDAGWDYTALHEFARPGVSTPEELAGVIAEAARVRGGGDDPPLAWALLDLDRAVPAANALGVLSARMLGAGVRCGFAPSAAEDDVTEPGMVDLRAIARHIAATRSAFVDDAEGLSRAAAAMVDRTWSDDAEDAGISVQTLPLSSDGVGPWSSWWTLQSGCVHAE